MSVITVSGQSPVAADIRPRLSAARVASNGGRSGYSAWNHRQRSLRPGCVGQRVHWLAENCVGSARNPWDAESVRGTSETDPVRLFDRRVGPRRSESRGRRESQHHR